jgi:hypothetical protein
VLAVLTRFLLVTFLSLVTCVASCNEARTVVRSPAGSYAMSWARFSRTTRVVPSWSCECTHSQYRLTGQRKWLYRFHRTSTTTCCRIFLWVVDTNFRNTFTSLLTTGILNVMCRSHTCGWVGRTASGEEVSLWLKNVRVLLIKSGAVVMVGGMLWKPKLEK